MRQRSKTRTALIPRSLTLVALGCVAAACSPASGVPPAARAGSPPDAATTGCTPTDRLATPRTVIRFRSDGCVPPDRLLGFRCTDADPIVIEIDAGSREAERFVGDRWATTMPALPRTAYPVGEGADLQVYRLPNDPKVLYVAQGDTVERWLRLPRLGASDPPTAFVIGDSIADGAEPSILEALPTWVVGFDAVVGRGTNSALSIADQQGAAGPDVVVIELGTNDADPATFRENAVSMLDALRHVPLVVWQTTHGPLENVPGVNVHIRGLAERYPNMVVADWDAFVRDDELSSDGVHPAPGHEALMAQLITPILSGWLELADGGGGSSCAAAAEMAAGVG